MYDDICINICVTVGFFHTGTFFNVPKKENSNMQGIYPKSLVNWVRKMPFSISINDMSFESWKAGDQVWNVKIFSFHPELSKGESVLTNSRCWCKVQSNVVDRSHCSWLLVVVDVDVNIYVAGYVDVDVYIDECPWGCVTLLLTSFLTSFLCCRNDLWALNFSTLWTKPTLKLL